MKPPFLGVRQILSVDLADIYDLVDIDFLYKKLWQVRNENLWQERLNPVYQNLQQFCLKQNLIDIKLSYGFFPFDVVDEGIVIDWQGNKFNFYFPRKRECLVDKIKFNYFIPCQVVTVGSGASDYEQKLLSEDRYSDYFYFHGFAAALSEACADYCHQLIGKDLIGRYEKIGKRYSLGYPLCPNLNEQIYLLKLLQAEKIGISITETYELVPELSTTAFVIFNEGEL